MQLRNSRSGVLEFSFIGAQELEGGDSSGHGVDHLLCGQIAFLFGVPGIQQFGFQTELL